MMKSAGSWRGKITAVIVSMLTVGASLPLHADDADDLFNVVSSLTAQTPTMFPLALTKTPGTVSVITQEQIKALGVTTLDQLLAYMPGVDAVMSPMGFAGNIRGFGGSPFQEGVQYLVDGFLYNSPDKGGSSTNPGYMSFPVPVEMIKQVEVVREPISSLYGPNAFYGVVNVITKSGADLHNGGSMTVRAGNRTTGRGVTRYSGLYGRQDGDWKWALSGDFNRELGPLVLNQKSRLQDTQGALKVENGRFLFSWLNQNSNTDPFPFLPAPFNVNSLPTQQNINLIGTQYEKNIVDGVALGTKTSYLSRHGTNCQVCHNVKFIQTTAANDQRESFYRVTQRLHTRISLLPRNEITLGGEFMYDKEHMDSGVSGDPRLVSHAYGEFLQDVVKVTDKISTTLGVRTDSSDWSHNKSQYNPRALVVYNYSDATTFRTGYTMAHRVPTYHDLHAFFRFIPVPAGVPAPSTFLMGDPQLKPESIQTYNLGADHWFSNQLLVSVNGFCSVVHDQIDRRIIGGTGVAALFPTGKLPNGDPIPPGTIIEQFANNRTDARLSGGELEFKFRAASWLDLDGYYGYKDVHFMTDPSTYMGGSQVPNAPRHKAVASATVYPVKGLAWTLSGRYRGAAYESFADQAAAKLGIGNLKAASDYLLVDTKIRYAFANGLEFSIIGNNIFNQRPVEWKIPLNTTLTTGRDFFFEASYAFGGEKPTR